MEIFQEVRLPVAEHHQDAAAHRDVFVPALRMDDNFEEHSDEALRPMAAHPDALDIVDLTKSRPMYLKMYLATSRQPVLHQPPRAEQEEPVDMQDYPEQVVPEQLVAQQEQLAQLRVSPCPQAFSLEQKVHQPQEQLPAVQQLEHAQVNERVDVPLDAKSQAQHSEQPPSRALH